MGMSTSCNKIHQRSDPPWKVDNLNSPNILFYIYLTRKLKVETFSTIIQNNIPEFYLHLFSTRNGGCRIAPNMV